MKKILFLLIVFLLYLIPANSEDDIKVIYEGNENAKIKIIVYESLTCGHCADFHKNVYPELKKNFLDNGLVKIEFRSFPLDLAALNASKIAHCKKPHLLQPKRQSGEQAEQDHLKHQLNPALE